MVKSIQDSLHDVSIELRILDDTTGAVTAGSAAHTQLTPPGAWSYPGYETDRHDKISAFTGKFEWKGVIEIQTTYKPGADPSDLSCYGRGTTPDDERTRDITLGFHESCHRLDYETFIKNNALPEPPTMQIGMTPKQYEAGTKAFEKAVDAYFEKASASSGAKTDEVGFRRSRALSTHQCFQHILPP